MVIILLPLQLREPSCIGGTREFVETATNVCAVNIRVFVSSCFYFPGVSVI